MIKLELNKEEAIAMLLMLVQEQKDYTHDPTCCPPRIFHIRNMINDIDKQLDALVKGENNDSQD